jgi:hypothetical protein
MGDRRGCYRYVGADRVEQRSAVRLVVTR